VTGIRGRGKGICFCPASVCAAPGVEANRIKWVRPGREASVILECYASPIQLSSSVRVREIEDGDRKRLAEAPSQASSCLAAAKGANGSFVSPIRPPRPFVFNEIGSFVPLKKFFRCALPSLPTGQAPVPVESESLASALNPRPMAPVLAHQPRPPSAQHSNAGAESSTLRRGGMGARSDEALIITD
jgi:hypothetical protein